MVPSKATNTIKMNTLSVPWFDISQPITGSWTMGPMEPSPLMTAAANTAVRREPTSMALVPESSESGPLLPSDSSSTVTLYR